MKQSDKERLKHILKAAQEIELFVQDKTFIDFKSDRLLQRGVEKDLEIIGEAANKLSNEVRDEFSQIPWKAIVGMRNILVHVYFELDLGTVWKTVQEDIPFLLKKLQKIDFDN